jgi:hypothetical protein
VSACFFIIPPRASTSTRVTSSQVARAAANDKGPNARESIGAFKI